MSYKQVRAYLFRKSYAYTIFQECIHSAKRKEKHRLRVRIAKMLLLGQIQQKIPRSITKGNEKLSTYIQIETELKRLVKERNERGVFDLEECKYALLDPAIERVAEKSSEALSNSILYSCTSWRRTICSVITYFETTVLPPEQLNYSLNLVQTVNS